MSTCPFILKTGKNKGEKCGSKVYQNGEFCKRHLPKSENIQENTEENKDTTNKTNKTNETTVNKEVKEKKNNKSKEKKEKITTEKSREKPKKEIKDEPSITHRIYETFKLSAKRNQYGNYVLENDLVVEPGPDRIILGRQFEDKIIDISIEDIEFCKMHGLMYKEPINMYFRNNENEKVEMKLQKELLKELKKKDEEELPGDNHLEDENEEDESDEENDDSEL
jgi:hypothetical protein